MDELLRDTGIDIIGKVAWGTHFCLFYETGDDLSEILVQYFKAGLESNEFCLWVTSEPLAEAKARKAMSKAMPHLDRFLKSGQIEIVPHDDWYLKDGAFNLQHALDGWIEKLEGALASGYSGLRATGNTAWLEPEDWTDFCQYEKEIDSIIGEQNTIALCAYSLEKCSASDVLNVVKNHDFALVKHRGAWELVESSRRKIALENLQDSEEKYRLMVESAKEGIGVVDARGNVIYGNKQIGEMLGYDVEKEHGRKWNEFVSEDSMPVVDAIVGTRYSGTLPDIKLRRKDGSEVWVIASTNPMYDKAGNYVGAMCLLTDVTAHKKLEEKLQESEARYRDLYDQAPVAYFSVGTDGLIKRANPCAGELLRCSLEELVGRPVFDLYADSPYGKARATVYFDKFLSGESVHDEVLQITRFDGEVIWISMSITPLRDPQGTVLEGLSSVFDVTELKTTRKAFKESESNFRYLTEHMSDLVWFIDLGLKVHYINPAVEKLLGYTPEEVYEMSIEEQITPASLERSFEMLVEELQIDNKPGVDPDRTRTIEIDYIHKNGSIKCSEMIVSFLRDEEGNPAGIFGVTRDISERKRAEEELKRINVELEGFAHKVSHDLKGPLSHITVATLMLQDLRKKSKESINDQFGEDIDELLEILNTGVNNAETLIEDLLSLARAGQVPEEVSDIDISEIVKTILEERNDAITGRGMTVEVEDGLGSVRGNPTQIYELFANLIVNAIKYNDNVNPVLNISHLGDDEDGLHRYLVRDNGPGIPPEYLDRIFTPFFKGENGETGVGLSIVDKIVTIYYGEIKAYNDNGACFEFTLRDY